MNREKVTGMMLTLLLISMLMLAFNVQSVEASGTIYIKGDGSVEPDTAPISTVDNITYTFTDNIYDEIVVERDNIVVDGAGFTLQGTGIFGSKGIRTGRTNVTIKNMEIRAFATGVYFYGASNNTIFENNITNNGDGIWLTVYSNYNSISGNNITNNDIGIEILGASNYNSISGNNITNKLVGIVLAGSSNNTIFENSITNKDYGITLSGASNYNSISGNNITNNDIGIEILGASNFNIIRHNNFVDNTEQAHIYLSLNNLWDDGYPSGGNYWSNYTGVDSDRDGIGDTIHVIDEDNQDNYPLMGMFSDFNVTSEYYVQTICNSTISNFQFNGTAICFNVTGKDGTVGFCRTCIPTALMSGAYKVFVNDKEVPHTLLPCSNSTHSYLYFSYEHSTQEVVIIPEFPTWTSILLTLILLTLAIAIYKRRQLKTPIH